MSAIEENSKTLGLHSFKMEFRSALRLSGVFGLWKRFLNSAYPEDEPPAKTHVRGKPLILLDTNEYGEPILPDPAKEVKEWARWEYLQHLIRTVVTLSLGEWIPYRSMTQLIYVLVSTGVGSTSGQCASAMEQVREKPAQLHRRRLHSGRHGTPFPGTVDLESGRNSSTRGTLVQAISVSEIPPTLCRHNQRHVQATKSPLHPRTQQVSPCGRPFACTYTSETHGRP
jgi:hypothetical protein